MKILLDTHILFNLATVDSNINPKLENILKLSSTEIFYSTATIYEIENKHKIGKWNSAKNFLNEFDLFVNNANILELPILTKDMRFAGNMDWDHKDPFDRILVAQAINRNLVFATDDERIKKLDLLNTIS